MARATVLKMALARAIMAGLARSVTDVLRTTIHQTYVIYGARQQKHATAIAIATTAGAVSNHARRPAGVEQGVAYASKWNPQAAPAHPIEQS